MYFALKRGLLTNPLAIIVVMDTLAIARDLKVVVVAHAHLTVNDQFLHHLQVAIGWAAHT